MLDPRFQLDFNVAFAPDWRVRTASLSDDFRGEVSGGVSHVRWVEEVNNRTHREGPEDSFMTSADDQHRKELSIMTKNHDKGTKAARKRVTIKDLPGSEQELNKEEMKKVKGGAVGPCNKPPAKIVGPCDKSRL